ncbi:PREDICTED: nucleolin 2-like [Erythranthe guttata]|uniref:nucleolin 2-like n=1 Tax=Erythranthe guttata TaxID=4155 RepID=UPI00064DFACF|nr:PREDICTED: nucleolin 2-like [Erythranthe guttata]|eukprot:XP_012837638.1 PREDICTED: nucleolin 2-like [Erythranthe guttata]
MASPPRNPLPADGDVHNDAAAPEPADSNLAIIVHPVNIEAMPICFIEPGDEPNPIDPDNFEFVGPSSTAGRTRSPSSLLKLHESSSNDSPPPASTQGETSQPNMAAAASQHSVSEDVAAHVPEDVAAPSDSANAPHRAAEDAAPYQDEEMPDFSGMSSAEHVDIPTVDAQDFTTTEETPSAPHPDPLETLAEAAVQVDASPSQTEEEETNDDSWEVPLATFRKNLPSSESDSDSSEESSQMQEDAAPLVASPELAYIPDELEDSEEEESSEEEEEDLLLQQFTHSLALITYHQSMVEMVQTTLSDQKGGEKASHEVEAGTSHPLDARGREQGVNEDGAKNESEAQGAEESSGSSADDGGAAADTEETLDIIL